MARKPYGRFGRSLVLLLALSTATGATQPSATKKAVHCTIAARCPTNSDEATPQGEGEVPRNQRPHHETDIIIPVAAVLVGGAAAVVMDQLTGNHWADPSELDKKGPRFPSHQRLGQFQVQGYADGGWPVVLDIETDPRAETWLELRIKDSKQQYRVEVPPGSGRRVIVVQFPGDPGPAPRVGRYSLRSAFIGAKSKPVYQPLRVFGIGAGPDAVGSTTLAITSFGPSEARLAADVRYSLHSTRIFQQSVVELLRLPKGGNKLDRVSEVPPSPLLQGRYDGDWAGLHVSPKVGRGVFALQARAWRLSADPRDRSWTGAAGPNFVVIP